MPGVTVVVSGAGRVGTGAGAASAPEGSDGSAGVAVGLRSRSADVGTGGVGRSDRLRSVGTFSGGRLSSENVSPSAPAPWLGSGFVFERAGPWADREVGTGLELSDRATGSGDAA